MIGSDGTLSSVHSAMLRVGPFTSKVSQPFAAS